MITKQPGSGFARTLKGSVKVVLIIEGALFLGSYGLWRCLNTSQDFRYYMRQHFPNILEGYYMLGEQLSGNDHIRTFDYKTWMEQRNEH